MDEEDCHTLAAVLAGFTITPEQCWFCVWEGYGFAELNALGKRYPRVNHEHRAYLLFSGEVSAAANIWSEPWFQSPTLWWPEDRAWCVATPLDVFSTYVAGSRACLAALTASPLEVLPASLDDLVDQGHYAAWWS